MGPPKQKEQAEGDQNVNTHSKYKKICRRLSSFPGGTRRVIAHENSGARVKGSHEQAKREEAQHRYGRDPTAQTVAHRNSNTTPRNPFIKAHAENKADGSTPPRQTIHPPAQCGPAHSIQLVNARQWWTCMVRVDRRGQPARGGSPQTDYHNARLGRATARGEKRERKASKI
jgi:hypothetical protein